ncbi:MAG: hypothetical protein MJ000_05125 [Bacteroidales bacterium]|nr:hypothetical protein [Bacteroidales bacterium]
MRKRIFLTMAVMAMVSFPAVSQSDGFFSGWEKNGIREDIDNGFDMPELPGHGYTEDQSGAPLGTGIVILTALGAGYAVTKKKDER